jgi:O-antigen/teichoic acid export membrane protein
LQLPRFSFGNLSEIIRFGGMRTVEQVLWNIYTSCDVFIIGRLLGPDVLGIYWVSRNLAALPVEKFAVTVGPAAMPAFALVQHDRAEALRYLRKAMRLLAFVCCPVFFGVAATAPQLVQVALGPKWSQASVPIALLAIGMALRPAGLVIAPFLMGLGEFAASLRNTIFATFLFPTAFVIGSHWGLLGVCAAWIVAYPLQLLALLRRVAIVARTSIGHLVAPLLPPLAGSLIMYAAVRGIEAMLPGNLGVWTAIIWLVGSGVLVYLGYTLLFLRPFAGELVGLARR